LEDYLHVQTGNCCCRKIIKNYKDETPTVQGLGGGHQLISFKAAKGSCQRKSDGVLVGKANTSVQGRVPKTGSFKKKGENGVVHFLPAGRKMPLGEPSWKRSTTASQWKDLVISLDKGVRSREREGLCLQDFSFMHPPGGVKGNSWTKGSF